MLPFKLVCGRNYYLPIGQNVFPVSKYRLTCEHLLSRGIATRDDFLVPDAAGDDDILLVHTPEYVNRLRSGTMSPMEELQLEVPLYPELVDAYGLCAGGTILAGQCALRDGIAFNIAGGFHHAFPDHGEGFNLINDVAIAIRRLQKDGDIETAMTVDCDVHHGNGNAAIFGSGEPPMFSRPGSTPYLRESAAKDVFTISIHQENNYPAWKPRSAIDVGLPDGTHDDDYLAWLEKALDFGLQRFRPDLICYLAGSDRYEGDLLGGLALTIKGLMRRDKLVLEKSKARNIPVLVVPAGGYASDVRDTVTIHSTGEQKPGAAEIAGAKPAAFPCPLVGAWKLSVAESQGDGPSPPSMEATVTRADETGFAWDLSATDKDGKVLFRASYAGPNDGKDHPIDILPGARTVAYVTADHELIATFKDESGNVVQRNRYRYSSDCNAETLKAFRMDTSGKEVLVGTEVFERLPPVAKPTKEITIKK